LRLWADLWVCLPDVASVLAGAGAAPEASAVGVCGREVLHDLFVMRDDVLVAVRGRAEALAAGDPEGLSRWLHEQFVWTSHRGEVFDRATYVAANTHELSWRSQVIEDPQVTIVGGTAVVVGTVRDVVEREGEVAVFVMRITQTWVRGAEGWRCLAGHAGPLSPDDHA
jgi:hypothetical protein